MKKYVLASLLCAVAYAQNIQMEGFLKELSAEAAKTEKNFAGFDAKRGEAIFFREIVQNGEKISCVSCHGRDLTKNGLNPKTNKVIEPMAPGANPKSLSDLKNVKKWLRRNFNDVYGREGTPLEKGDVLTFLLSK